MKKLLLLFVALLMIFPIKIYAASNTETKSITVNKGENFTISLSENATTGYTWTYTVNPTSGLSLVSNDVKTDSNLAGAGSTRNIVFKADQEGSYTITCVQARSWDPSNPASTIVYNVTVNDTNTNKTETKNITVNKGENFTISLNENGTTGYTWSYSINPQEGLTLVSNDVNANSNLAGAGSVRNITFKADQVGTYTITCVQARSWDPSNPASTIVYNVTVNDTNSNNNSNDNSDNNCSNDNSDNNCSNDNSNNNCSNDNVVVPTNDENCVYYYLVPQNDYVLYYNLSDCGNVYYSPVCYTFAQ